MSETDGRIDMRYYSAALDEIYALRTALAIEAAAMNELLRFRTLPLTGVQEIIAARSRMVRSARSVGGSSAVYHELGVEVRTAAMKEFQVPELLTRAQWEAEVDRR